MERGENIVLRAVSDGRKRVLGSFDPSDPLAQIKVSHAVAGALSDAQKRGVPAPEIECVLVMCECDDARKHHTINETALSPVSLRPIKERN